MGYEQVELAVVIIVEPDCASGEAGVSNARLGGNILKLSVAEIPEQVVAVECGDL